MSVCLILFVLQMSLGWKCLVIVAMVLLGALGLEGAEPWAEARSSNGPQFDTSLTQFSNDVSKFYFFFLISHRRYQGNNSKLAMRNLKLKIIEFSLILT